MFENKKTVHIEIANRKVELIIFGESSTEENIFELEKSDAEENGEATLQIKEGYFYEYKITDGFKLESSDVVIQSRVNQSTGRISPNIYVGTLTIGICEIGNNIRCGEIKLEVQSVKTSYRQDYRHMLEEITEKCTDLLLQHNSPVNQYFEVDFNADANTLYQRFAFIKSILDSVEFADSVNKIVTAPVTRWQESETDKDIRGVKRINQKILRQIAGATNRIDLPETHLLKQTLHSVPSKVRITFKTETVDTPENRFIKHALSVFLSFVGEFRIKLNNSGRIKQEAILIEDKLEMLISHSVFKEISAPTTLSLNSPVLQRKEGYREILKVWLMFDLAAKLVWHGGDDVYSGGKRDVAVLYEYWLFFKLLDIIKEVFKIDSTSVENLIESTKDGLGLKLKQGKFLPIKGIYLNETRKLNIEFSYNKTFSGEKEYPLGGSWTRNLRPDYTLSVWPFGIEQEQAEIEELIVHIHFDAKYKIENLKTIFGSDETLDEEKEEQKKGTYKRADILKMHTYRDAIRRTAGAYVLYPGSQSDKKFGFHELLPGLGAFAIRPSRQNDGTEDLKLFLNEVVNHFLNRASQREKMSLKTFEIYKNKSNNELNEALPETFGKNRNMLPDETYILIGFYKDIEHLKWINQNKIYNARTGSSRGSVRLSPKETGAKYLLLHSNGEIKTNKLLKLNDSGPRVFSKEKMISKSYVNPSQDYYLVFDIEHKIELEFENMVWDISKLEGFKGSRNSGLPFSVSFTELMKVVVK